MLLLLLVSTYSCSRHSLQTDLCGCGMVCGACRVAVIAGVGYSLCHRRRTRRRAHAQQLESVIRLDQQCRGLTRIKCA